MQKKKLIQVLLGKVTPLRSPKSTLIIENCQLIALEFLLDLRVLGILFIFFFITTRIITRCA